MREGGGRARDLRMQDAIGELFYIIDFLLLGNEEAKIRVVLPESV